MQTKSEYDAVVIGSGPNGFSAAITLAQAGLSVAIFESKSTVGGGMRSAELTLPGYIHDICSAIHPLAIASPFFSTLPLNEYGQNWIHPPVALAHPFDDGTAAILQHSIEATGKTLGIDCDHYSKLMEPLVKIWGKLSDDILAPLHFPKHPIALARFSLLGLRSAQELSQSIFKGDHARAFFAGLAAHSTLPLDKYITAGFGLVLGMLGHVKGWPISRGGSQKIADALNAIFQSLGGQVFTNVNIQNIDDLPRSRIILCDITPKQLLQIAGHKLPSNFKNSLNNYRYGPGVFKIDWALNHPIPWTAKECAQAGTIHLGGSEKEIILSEREVWNHKHAERPYIILAQQSLFDTSRAPAGKHTAWGYCHVPNGSNVDMTDRIEAQIERFAPGFKDCVLARNRQGPREFELYNANYVGGDINGGVQDIYQFLTRPTARLVPYSTPVKGLYICSSSTPPGGGVHGMCGYHAAQAALKTL